MASPATTIVLGNAVNPPRNGKKNIVNRGAWGLLLKLEAFELNLRALKARDDVVFR
jgi:hypothetical protein